ncbi:MAG: hypothetical protein M1835_003080 [Candelina submexicana]|nr:MAG: hypothetical protein M1835_003080 [Candelina submexicana]
MENARNTLETMDRHEPDTTEKQRVGYMDTQTNEAMLDDDYVSSFVTIGEKLRKVRDELRAFYNFLTKICEEGNMLSSNPTDDSMDTQERTAEAPELSWDERYPTFEAYQNRPPTPPPPNTPSWKRELSHLYAPHNLFVGSAEIHAFKSASARISHIGPLLADTINGCKAAHALGVVMQQVWNEWRETIQKYSEAEVERETAVTTQANSQDIDGLNEERSGQGNGGVTGLLNRSAEAVPRDRIITDLGDHINENIGNIIYNVSNSTTNGTINGKIHTDAFGDGHGFTNGNINGDTNGNTNGNVDGPSNTNGGTNGHANAYESPYS